MAGPDAAPTGVVPRREPAPRPEAPATTDAPARPVAHAPSGGRDAGGFLDYVRKEGKPGLVSFVGNAFRARLERGALTLFFDETHANLIPMIKSSGHQDTLGDLAEAYFGTRPEVGFDIGRDPRLVARNEQEEQAMQRVNAHPTIKFLLDTFNGKIVNCQIMGEEKE